MAAAKARFSLWPVGITTLALLLLVGYSGYQAGWNWPLTMLPGRAFAPAGLPTLPGNAQGYDGQFGLYMALYPPPQVAHYLDVPAYRYQRVLLPALARALGGRTPTTYPWAAWTVLGIGHLLGVVVLQQWLRAWGQRQTWALLYGLWPGLMLAFRAGLPEPLSYGLALVGLAAARQQRSGRAALALFAAMLAKETALLIVMAVVAAWSRSRPRQALGLAVAVGLPWALWQGLLYALFGRVGLGSGGAGATGWAWPPLSWLVALPGWLFMLAHRAPALLLVYGLVLVALLPPLAASIGEGARLLWTAWQQRRWPSLWDWLLLSHAAAATLVPWSTWGEPWAAPRVLTGLLLAFWLHRWRQGQTSDWRWLLPWWEMLWVLPLARPG